MVWEAVHVVLSIFIMIAVGAYLTHLNWLNDSNASLVSRLVVKVGLPFLIINNLFTSYTRETLLESLPNMVVPFIALGLALALSIGLGRLTGIPKGRRGAFTCMFSFSNSVFVGLPVSTALFGEQAIPYAMMFYIANTVFFWTVGISLLGKDANASPERGNMRRLPAYLAAKARYFARRADNPDKNPALRPGYLASLAIRRALPLPLVVFFMCYVLVLLGVRLPQFVLGASKYIGNIVTPLSLFFIGILIMRMLRGRRIRWERGYALMLVGRFVVTPGLIYVASLLFPMPVLMRNVLIMQACMPVMSQTSIVSESVGADAEYTAGGIALSTLASLAVIPLYMAIIARI